MNTTQQEFNATLKNGKRAFVFEIAFPGMAGESMSALKYIVEGEKEEKWVSPDIDLFSDKDKEELKEMMSDISDSNEASAIAFVK